MVPVGVTFAPLVYTCGLDLDLEIKLHLGNNTGDGLPAKEEETHPNRIPDVRIRIRI